MMKTAIIVILSSFLIFLGVQIWHFTDRTAKAEAEYQATLKELEKAEAERDRLQADEEYLKNPANLEKELKSRFNYRKPDEKLIIIVPPAESPKQQ